MSDPTKLINLLRDIVKSQAELIAVLGTTMGYLTHTQEATAALATTASTLQEANDTLEQQLAAAQAGAVTPELEAAVDAVAAKVKANYEALVPPQPAP